VRHPGEGHVIFTASDKDIERLDIAVGPCVDRVGPRGGHLRPLASPLDQLQDPPGHLEALGAIVVPGPPGDLWTECHADRPGRLCLFSPWIATALAQIWMSSNDPDEVDGHRLPSLDEVAQAWFSAVPWPERQQVNGLTSRLLNVVWKARRARDHDQGLYSWFGPMRPWFALASGTTEQEYEAYKATKRRG
jgi:hypothetical protein